MAAAAAPTVGPEVTVAVDGASVKIEAGFGSQTYSTVG